MVHVQLFTCGNVTVLHIIVIIIHIADYDITEINTILQLMKSACYIVDRRTVCGSYTLLFITYTYYYNSRGEKVNVCLGYINILFISRGSEIKLRTLKSN